MYRCCLNLNALPVPLVISNLASSNLVISLIIISNIAKKKKFRGILDETFPLHGVHLNCSMNVVSTEGREKILADKSKRYYPALSIHFLHILSLQFSI